MQLEIRLYATLKDKVGQNKVTVEMDLPSTVDGLIDQLINTYPQLKVGLGTAVVSVNREFATPDTPVKEGDEIAIFPPVSGGSTAADMFPHPVFFALAEEDPDVGQIHAHLQQPDVGAIITFSGFVRGETQRQGMPSHTLELEYEAYEEMAVERMGQIAREIWEQWPLVKGVAIIQRIGKLKVGEATTFVACAAGHRDQGAFEAARYGIDRLKEIVPVWKKEVGPDASVWVEGSYQPTVADN